VTTTRRFAAFTRNGRDGLGISEIPKDGFCISVFLIIRQRDRPGRVLMGRINPDADWAHIGALTQDRIEAHGGGWMLPSCHLIYGESPHDAAQRIVREQLALDKELKFAEPKVHSEVYTPKRHSAAKEHWDLQFLFEGELDLEELRRMRRSDAWRRLEFVDIGALDKSEFARSHEDIIARVDSLHSSPRRKTKGN
jgi:ADP-ribose pyrophosphatase YjhB (NUDIX family)